MHQYLQQVDFSERSRTHHNLSDWITEVELADGLLADVRIATSGFVDGVKPSFQCLCAIMCQRHADHTRDDEHEFHERHSQQFECNSNGFVVHDNNAKLIACRALYDLINEPS